MHIIFNELGKEIAADFYFNIQTVVNNWLVYNGHSIGMFFFDLVSNVFINLLETLRKVVESKVIQVNELVKRQCYNTYLIKYQLISYNHNVYRYRILYKSGKALMIPDLYCQLSRTGQHL